MSYENTSASNISKYVIRIIIDPSRLNIASKNLYDLVPIIQNIIQSVNIKFLSINEKNFFSKIPPKNTVVLKKALIKQNNGATNARTGI